MGRIGCYDDESPVEQSRRDCVPSFFICAHSRQRAVTMPWGLTLRNRQSTFGFGGRRMTMMPFKRKKDKRWKNNIEKRGMKGNVPT